MTARSAPALLREVTDEAVLRELMETDRLTRAEIAARSRISKPTVAESIRRLEALDLVHDTGERTSGRGGVGSYYALAPQVGVAVAVSVAPEGLVAEVVDTTGGCVARVAEPIDRRASAAETTRQVGAVVGSVVGGIERDLLRAAVVSAADPVDRVTGALVHLPDAPFLLGALSLPEVLGPLISVSGSVSVDNDVNWAARSERDARLDAGESDLDDIVYLHLGEGLGGAVISDGRVRRGHRGLAGEVAHVATEGPDGRVTPFIAVFDRLGLTHDGSTAIDVDRVLDALTGEGGAELATTLATAIRGVLAAAVAFTDPGLVVVGGPWGTAPTLLAELRRQASAMPRAVLVEQALLVDEPALSGARRAARETLRADVVARSAG